METLIQDLGAVCIKVYTLEKVLGLKRDMESGVSFLDEAMSVRPSSLLEGADLDAEGEAGARQQTELALLDGPFPVIRNSSSRNDQTLELRPIHLQQRLPSTPQAAAGVLFHYRGTYRHCLLSVSAEVRLSFLSCPSVSLDERGDSPETVLVLRAILPFETLYLNRSSTRLTESVASSFSISSSLSSSFTNRPATVPTANEGLSAARAVVNELDAARFDPLLVKAVAKGASKALESFVTKAIGLVRVPPFVPSLR
jgi:hypothetical protein